MVKIIEWILVGFNFLLYFICHLLPIERDMLEDQYDGLYINYIKGYGWLKPNTEIPGDKIPQSDRTVQRLKWMEENNIRIVENNVLKKSWLKRLFSRNGR